MGSLFLWLVIGYFVFKKLGNVLHEVAKEHQEQMERHAEQELEEEEQEYVEEYSPQEEPIIESPFDTPSNAVVPPPLKMCIRDRDRSASANTPTHSSEASPHFPSSPPP